ncbi:MULTISPECIES: type I glyceraldehyde-3-phosphate dehydrogenase [Agrobacterium]|jgi:glyceraldehyde 3-phosphate dehydrogenase|uniref:type I glyceraldehyde-3-phosphate dehydrogenase n=1 Tax=Agrobacterium TaxID=357 RepID=UPI001FAA8CD8|nr:MULTISPECIES: aldehyde dehydrogenase [Agrobacterium]MCZ7889483.1 aldehyde dehydrogenase [Agrobacterium salinitolerans]UNZ54012.1 aldehyde dehydrogenase [Agrobacterium tumefaciens]
MSDSLVIDGRIIPFHHESDIGSLDLSNVDVVLECTGHRDTLTFSRSSLSARARRVVISGPAKGADMTLVMGANEESYRDQHVVSNGSCTTNAIAPLLRIVDDQFGVIGGHLTTVHCYTGSQPTVDQPRGDPARSRAAALSMVPTTTSAHLLLGEVLPHLAGLIEARALRVPTASVSAIDLTVALRAQTDIGSVRDILRDLCERSPVLGWIEKPLVSVDLRGRPESLIVSGPELSMSAAGGLLRIFGWYDNEWGFANRMLEMALLVGNRNLERMPFPSMRRART